MKTPSERLEKSLTNDNLWIYILTLLREGDMYPYEVREKIRERFGFSPGNMTAYIVLKKLEAGGFVSVSKKGQDKGPEKSYYSVTGKGLDELSRAKDAFSRFSGFLES